MSDRALRIITSQALVEVVRPGGIGGTSYTIARDGDGWEATMRPIRALSQPLGKFATLKEAHAKIATLSR